MPNARIKHLPTLREYRPGEWVEVAERPSCNACVNTVQEAFFDARAHSGHWGYFCPTHFRTLGCKLGTGFGQRLVLEGEYKVIE